MWQCLGTRESEALKELSEWLDSLGCSPQAWIAGDWHIPLQLISKLMTAELEQRKISAIKFMESRLHSRRLSQVEEGTEVTYKISFDSMLELGEEVLGIPVFVTESDLTIRYPNINLALLTYLVCLHHTIDHINPKQVRNAMAFRLVFEAKNGREVSLPSCPQCREHVFIIDRVVVERSVWHRNCFKCTECGRLLVRGAYKKTRTGFECIQHALRRILETTESSGNGSIGYSGVGDSRMGGKSPRPTVAPPPRPRPKPPPKPSRLLKNGRGTVSDDTYETLDEVKAITEESEYQQKMDESVVPELSSPTKKEDIDPLRSAHEGLTRQEEDASSPASPKNKEETSTLPSPSASSVEESASSGEISSSDSGVVLRMARMFSGEAGLLHKEHPASRASQPMLSPRAPIPPPRPKRTSMLVSTSSGQSPVSKNVPMSPTLSSRCSTFSRSQSTSTPVSQKDASDYPETLNPFDEDEDEDLVEEYDSSKNPFADSDDESSRGPPVPAPRSRPPPPPELPGTSDRPKVQPPPPPSEAAADVVEAPPKPARGNFSPSTGGDTRIQTLKISRKKYKAPLPPIPQRRKINITGERAEEDIGVVEKRLAEIEELMGRVEVDGRAIEKEMLFQIATNPATWTKSQRTDDWIEVLTRKLDLIREQLQLLGRWREHFLNDVHSETEYFIRCLLEKDDSQKTEWEIEREATLTNLLIYIIDEKLKLDEYMWDMNQNKGTREVGTLKSAKSKKLKLIKRLTALTKKTKASKGEKNRTKPFEPKSLSQETV